MAKSRIAEAYVQIVPSFDGLFSGIAGVLGGAAFAGAFDNAGDDAGGRFTDAFTEQLGNITKAVAITVAGATALIGGLIVQGGFARALNIEEAQAKLSGLGYSVEEIGTIMDSTLAAVKGTAFALDQGMNIATTAIAAGIKSGDELTNYLRLVADTATITGSSLGEIGPILNRVQATQRAYTQDLNMLADRGLPIFSWLQEAYGVTAVELRKMVSDGKVDAETFRAVLEKNVGGAALEAGTTTTGSFENMRTAMNRFGAAMVTGLLPILTIVFQTIIPIFDALTNRFGPAMTIFWENFGMRAIPAIQALSAKLIELIQTGSTGGEPGFLSKMFELAMKLVPIFQSVYATLQPIFANLFASLGPALKEIFIQIGPILAQLITTLAPIGLKILELIVSFSPLLNIIGVLAQAMPGLANAIMPLLDALGPGLLVLLDAITPVLNGLSIVFTQLVGQIVESVIPIIAGLAEVFVPVATTIGTLVSEIFAALLPAFSQIIAMLAPLIQQLVPILVKLILQLAPVISKLATIIGKILTGALGAAIPVLGMLIEAIAPIVEVVGDLAIQVLDALMPAISVLADLIGPLFTLLMIPLQMLAKMLGVVLPPIIRALTPVIVMMVQAFTLGIWVIASALIMLYNGIVDLFNGFRVEIPPFAQEFFGTDEIAFNMPKAEMPEIPQFAQGGNVRGTKDGTPGIFGENFKSETVSDLGLTNSTLAETRDLVRSVKKTDSRGNQTTVYLTVNPPADMDVDMLATKLQKKILQSRRR